MIHFDHPTQKLPFDAPAGRRRRFHVPEVEPHHLPDTVHDKPGLDAARIHHEEAGVVRGVLGIHGKPGAGIDGRQYVSPEIADAGHIIRTPGDGRDIRQTDDLLDIVDDHAEFLIQ